MLSFQPSTPAAAAVRGLDIPPQRGGAPRSTSQQNAQEAAHLCSNTGEYPRASCQWWQCCTAARVRGHSRRPPHRRAGTQARCPGSGGVPRARRSAAPSESPPPPLCRSSHHPLHYRAPTGAHRCKRRTFCSRKAFRLVVSTSVHSTVDRLKPSMGELKRYGTSRSRLRSLMRITQPGIGNGPPAMHTAAMFKP